MKRVLVAPLDWGLGHATRCIPIVHELLNRNNEVVVASSGSARNLLLREFPELTHIELPAYRPEYSAKSSMVTTMLRQVPRFFRTIDAEHEAVERIVKQHKIDFVISDNRYGCWTDQVPSVIITHQLNLQMPNGLGWLRPIVNHVNKRHILKFSACWIPDFPEKDKRLSGDLSSNNLRNVRYIGPLSRFAYMQREEDGRRAVFDIACIVSGPEPQRSLFQKKLMDTLRPTNLRYIFASGLVPEQGRKSYAIEGDRFLSSAELFEIVRRSSVVIARSGYSTIMDLAATGTRAILIATPGQTEQEYLARRFQDRQIFATARQDKLDLKTAMHKAAATNGLTIDWKGARDLLESALQTI